jgi:hypothetical protein
MLSVPLLGLHGKCEAILTYTSRGYRRCLGQVGQGQIGLQEMSAYPVRPLTLGNMRKLGVQYLIASCLNEACRHSAMIDVSSYPAQPMCRRLVATRLCGNCGGKRVDVRPNWKEQSTRPSLPGRNGGEPMEWVLREARSRIARSEQAKNARAIQLGCG